MKKTASIFGIAAGLLLSLSGTSFGQNGNIPSESRARMHNEVQDHPYVPVQPGTQGRSTPARIDGTGFSMVQVNVDGSGQNILGDAANEPSIAIDPLNPAMMAIGWRQFDDVSNNFRQAGWGYTSNGGLTWTFPGSSSLGSSGPTLFLKVILMETCFITA